MPKFGITLPKMDDVFKSHPKPDVTKDLMAKYRLRAIDILQNIMPAKIIDIENLINQEKDSSSPFYTGQVFEAAYSAPKLIQPALIVDENENKGSGESSLTDKPIMPADITTCSTTGEEKPQDVRIGQHWFEVVKVNKNQMKCNEIVFKELEELHMLAQDLKVWLEMEIPVVEDGNSFGADVQAHLISQLTEAYKKSNTMQNGVRAHHGDRLKLATDWAKYPNFEDYAAAIANSDRFDHFLIRSFLRSILQLYAGLLTKFEKNWTKVINPKGTHETGGMY
ncbi:uncharacterized protein I206_107649 [Kwoniella pini CBS 10737]|uniref:Proteasome activator PA28 C-terminal domain-containing protein n=1 Tax=Kwoniella pini CBS 10737 TaxID=1296096 RepID=A0A1B9HXW2_9TREE|nr:uncharacterized protein I206_05984 [Kwoniella pini CBS 10737]OCF48116.1 hypothetical protein I206_05984 [Kwoniella pini CBS 10737]